MPRKIVLATVGSLGDLHPFIAIALQLKAHGYEPIVATGAHFRQNVETAGLAFHAVRPSRDDLFRDLRMDIVEFGGRVMRDTLYILRAAVLPYLRDSYQDLQPVIDGAALVLTSSLAYSARLAAEAQAVPQMTVALQPMMFISAHDPPRLDPLRSLAPILAALGPGAARVVYAAAKKIAAREASALYSFRDELGLPATNRNPLFEGQFSSLGTLATYSDLLGPIRPDYPPRTTITGFAFYDGNTNPAGPLPWDLEEFLSSGPPPVVVTLGSFAVEFPGDFYEVSHAAARALGERVVLLVGPGRSEHYRGPPAEVFVSDYAPFSQLFPHARAIIHQGGIGTVGQSLRAGKPQLIVPVLADQFDNATRVVRLGIARTVARRRYTKRRALSALGSLLANSLHASRTAAIAERLAHEDGAAEAVRVIERVLGDRSSQRGTEQPPDAMG
jgi:UDP:flavonoid glycosyltransferase YjiC (YdhE family)